MARHTYMRFEIKNLEELEQMIQVIKDEVSGAQGENVHPSTILIGTEKFNVATFELLQEDLSDGSAVFNVEVETDI